MTNQTPALLVQRAPWTRAAVMLLQSLYSSPPSPRAIIPDARSVGTFKNQDSRDAVTVRRGISKRPHEKIGDCEQSRLDNLTNIMARFPVISADFPA